MIERVSDKVLCMISESHGEVIPRARVVRQMAEELIAHRERLVRLMATFDFIAHLRRQREWSARTFGPDLRMGVLDHIRKELVEIEAAPTDLSEWIDVVILALDGAWRAGHSPEAIVAALVAKQAKNEGRTWPDWRGSDPSKAIEHDRSRGET